MQTRSSGRFARTSSTPCPGWTRQCAMSAPIDLQPQGPGRRGDRSVTVGPYVTGDGRLVSASKDTPLSAGPGASSHRSGRGSSLPGRSRRASLPAGGRPRQTQLRKGSSEVRNPQLTFSGCASRTFMTSWAGGARRPARSRHRSRIRRQPETRTGVRRAPRRESPRTGARCAPSSTRVRRAQRLRARQSQWPRRTTAR